MTAQAAAVILDIAPIVVGEVVDIISGIINLNKGKDVRSGWTEETLGKACAKFPGRNVTIVWTMHDASGLRGPVQGDLLGPRPNQNKTMKYKCYISDSGIFHLQGDGSSLKLGFRGTI